MDVKLLQIIIRILYYDQHVLHMESGQAYFPVQISGKVRFQRHVRTRGLTCIRYVEYENFNN